MTVTVLDRALAATGTFRRAVEFAHSAFRHACLALEWSTDLLGSTESSPPPVR
jgi:hypothetical protein